MSNPGDDIKLHRDERGDEIATLMELSGQGRKPEFLAGRGEIRRVVK